MFHFSRPIKLPATVAILDCGTNSVLLLVARLEPNGTVTALHQAIAAPRLGQGLAGKGRLSSRAVARTLLALRKLKKQADRFKPDIFLALGTNVFRRAKDGRAAARYFEKKSGIPIIILSPSEEARLEFSGATSGMRTSSKIVVVDVGGGSSEVIWGQSRKITRKVSFEIGAVRLKEKFPRINRCGEKVWRMSLLEINRTISKLKSRKNYPLAVLTGGTATALAAFSLGLRKYKGEKVHGFLSSPEVMKKALEKLSRLNLAQRKKALPFDSARADIILSGGILLLEILQRLKTRKVIVSDHGLRWGAAYSYFS